MSRARAPRPQIRHQSVWCLALALIIATECGADSAPRASDATPMTTPSSDVHAPVGLAIEIDNGVGQPLQLPQGQRFYLNQIDMPASVDNTQDDGVAPLAHMGDFAELRWEGTRLADQEFVLLANPDGTFTRRRFYRDAAWMEAHSTFTLEQRDAHGRSLAPPLVVNAGAEGHRREHAAFLHPRLGAMPRRT